MPVIKNRIVLGIARGLNAFVTLDVGLIRGEVANPEQQLQRTKGQLSKQHRQIEQIQKQIRTNNQNSQKQHRQIEQIQKQIRANNQNSDETREKDPQWHRSSIGGEWDEIGQLQFDFLRSQGLQPRHYFLVVGCGALRGGVHFIPYLASDHYYGIDKSKELLDAGREELGPAKLQERRPILVQMGDFGFQSLGQTFDYALAQSVFTHLPLNHVARCLVNMDRVLRPGGVFFATFFENRNGKQYLEPLAQGAEMVQGTQLFTNYDRDPFHYTPDAFVWACEGTSLEVEYIGDGNILATSICWPFGRRHRASSSLRAGNLKKCSMAL